MPDSPPCAKATKCRRKIRPSPFACRQAQARQKSSDISAWLARDSHFDRDVALKELRGGRAVTAGLVHFRFLREARITAQLDHPRIVQVFELATDADTPYIAMQYVDGIDVLGLLRECARAQPVEASDDGIANTGVNENGRSRGERRHAARQAERKQ